MPAPETACILMMTTSEKGRLCSWLSPLSIWLQANSWVPLLVPQLLASAGKEKHFHQGQPLTGDESGLRICGVLSLILRSVYDLSTLFCRCVLRPPCTAVATTSMLTAVWWEEKLLILFCSFLKLLRKMPSTEEVSREGSASEGSLGLSLLSLQWACWD